jgi:hypothetical protein
MIKFYQILIFSPHVLSQGVPDEITSTIKQRAFAYEQFGIALVILHSRIKI